MQKFSLEDLQETFPEVQTFASGYRALHSHLRLLQLEEFLCEMLRKNRQHPEEEQDCSHLAEKVHSCWSSLIVHYTIILY